MLHHEVSTENQEADSSIVIHYMDGRPAVVIKGVDVQPLSGESTEKEVAIVHIGGNYREGRVQPQPRREEVFLSPSSQLGRLRLHQSSTESEMTIFSFQCALAMGWKP